MNIIKIAEKLISPFLYVKANAGKAKLASWLIKFFQDLPRFKTTKQTLSKNRFNLSVFDGYPVKLISLEYNDPCCGEKLIDFWKDKERQKGISTIKLRSLICFSKRIKLLPNIFLQMKKKFSEANKARLVDDSLSSTSLTPNGISQIKRTSAAILSRDIKPDRIFCGTCKRHTMTAEIIRDELGIDKQPIVVNPRLNDINAGKLVNLPTDTVPLWATEGDFSSRYGANGESISMVDDRLAEFTRDMTSFRLDRSVIVTSQLTGKLLYNRINGNAQLTYPFIPVFDNGCVLRI